MEEVILHVHDDEGREARGHGQKRIRHALRRGQREASCRASGQVVGLGSSRVVPLLAWRPEAQIRRHVAVARSRSRSSFLCFSPAEATAKPVFNLMELAPSSCAYEHPTVREGVRGGGRRVGKGRLANMLPRFVASGYLMIR